MSVSVFIRCRNEEHWIGHAIQSVLDMIEVPEIIIVDNGSTDDSKMIVKHFQKNLYLEGPDRVDIKVVDIDDYSPGRALNLGIAMSTKENILILSAHSVLSRINIEKHIDSLKNYICVFGNQIPVWRGRRIRKNYLWSHFKNEEEINMYSEQEDRYFLHNALSLYRRDVLIDHPFDEELVGKEDRYWANEMISHGFETLYDPELECHHHYTDGGNTWKGLG